MKSRFALPAALVTLALCSCLGNSGSATPPPGDVRVYAGDTQISITWQVTPFVDYWVFHAQDPTLSTGSNWSQLLGAGVLVAVGSPAILCNQLNNPTQPSYFPATYFTVNGRTGSSPGGVGSPVVSTVPRPAGGPYSSWIAGNTVPAAVSSIGYAAITGCGYAGRPASGSFIAVGPSATIYSAQFAPAVAGPLSLAVGNQPLTWVRGTVTSGFSADLTGVAAYSYANAANTPGVASVLYVAVGKNGAVLRSADGQNWEAVSGVPTSANLNAIAVAGSTFIAVGDQGTVITSGDGLNWSLNNNATTISTNTLNAIHCVSSSCVAVGNNGTTMWTTSSGASWSLFPYGTNNWTAIAYGNANANAAPTDGPAVVTYNNGVLAVNTGNESINTWLVVDANGSYATANTVGGWSGSSSIAPGIVAVDYTTRFVAIDGAGNAYASYTGTNWQSVGSSNVANAVAMRSNGVGFVAIGSSGANAAAF